jgi:hypothetical protein
MQLFASFLCPCLGTQIQLNMDDTGNTDKIQDLFSV